MNPKIVFCVLFVLILEFISVTTRTVSQTQPVNNGPIVRPFTDLTLEIDTVNDVYLTLQPISVILKLQNKTDSLAYGYDSISLDGYPLVAFVRPVGGERTKIRRLSLLSGLNGVIHTAIPPGHVAISKGWLTLNLSDYFPRRGAYELQFKLFNSDATKSIDSNTIRINIQEPVGIDRFAHDLIGISSTKDYIFSGQEFETSKSVLERLVMLYPTSAYAKSALFVLGENYFYNKKDSEALTDLIRLENDFDFICFEKVRHYLAEIRRRIAAQSDTKKTFIDGSEIAGRTAINFIVFPVPSCNESPDHSDW